MTVKIILKDHTGVGREFQVVRQPSAGVSAILLYQPAGSFSRDEARKIELSASIKGGAVSPVASVAVPYGATTDGIFQKKGQVNDIRRSSQPANAMLDAIAESDAYASGLVANAQVIELFRNGVI